MRNAQLAATEPAYHAVSVWRHFVPRVIDYNLPFPHRTWHTVRIKNTPRFHSEPFLAGESQVTIISEVGSLLSIPIRFSDRL